MPSWLPQAAFVAGSAAALLYLSSELRRSEFRRRPVLIAAALFALLVPLLAGLSWSGFADVPVVRFERPWLAVPVTLAVLAGLRRLERLSSRQNRTRRLLTELLSALALLTAGLGVTGLELGRPLDRLSIMIAVDRSRSIDLVAGADSRIAAELSVAELGMREEDRIGTLAFGATAAVEDPLRPKTRLPAPQRVEIGRDGTDLGAAIRHALGELPPDSAGRVVLLTDGVSTRGDPLGGALGAVAAGVPVDVVPLDQSELPNVRVSSVRLPARASRGEPIELRVITRSSKAARVEVRVSRDGVPIRKGTVAIAEGEDVLHLRELAPESGFHRYDVAISAQDATLDQAPEDNEASAFMRVRGEATALILDQNPELVAPLARALESAAFRVTVKGALGVPHDVAGLASYDLIALGDLPAPDLHPSQIEALASYVRHLGGGLLLLGGDRSLGPGGYGKTPIEEVSPVSFDVKQERRRASLAEVIAVDFSGSMSMRVGKQTKLELANEAAVRSSELLGAGDRLGVMHVDTVVHWTVPLGPVADRSAISSAIRNVSGGGGGIYVDLTLEAAYAALERERVQLKHLLLFSDGADAEERANAFGLVSSAKGRGITTSVVALGQGSDVPDLEQLSRLGGGRFYLIEDATRLPAVFAQETVLASRSAINEVSFRPRLVTPGPAVRGIDFASAPALTGYVVTVPKGRAQIHLAGPENDPVLAIWSAGLGRAAVFTSDFRDRWGLGWTSWDGASKLFGQVARDIARRPDDPRVRLEADTEGGVFRLRAFVLDERGRRESFRRLEASISGPDGTTRVVPLEASGSGSYVATLPLERPGAYVAAAVDSETRAVLGVTGAALSRGEELRPTGSDRALLRRIAEQSGGKVRDTLAGLFDDRPPRRFAYSSVAPELALLVSLALLGAVTARRLAFPDALTRFVARRATRRAERRAARAARRKAKQQSSPAMVRSPSVPETTGTSPDDPRATGELTTAPPARSQTPLGSLDALRQARARRADTRFAVDLPRPNQQPELPRPGSPGAFSPPATRSPGAAPPAPPVRTRTAAEILLERRRGRQR